jgi:hypothetical protein
MVFTLAGILVLSLQFTSSSHLPVLFLVSSVIIVIISLSPPPPDYSRSVFSK